MTPAELKSAREALDLSLQGLADLLRMEGKNARTTVHRWETGRIARVPGYAAVVLELALAVPAARKFLGL